jgi:prepilin peptidase CpaA
MQGARLFLGIALVVSAIGGWCDWRTGHIPNWLTLTTLVGAPLLHVGWLIAHGRSPEALAQAGMAVLGAAACAAVPLLLFRMEAIGGGDVKLLAGLGALCLPMIGVELELYAFLAAAVFAPGRLAYEGKLGKVLRNTVILVKNPFLPKERRHQIQPEMLTSLRFGPAVFAGTCGAAFLHWRSP